MKILRRAKVEAVTFGEGQYVRVQATGLGKMEPGAGSAQVYFSALADLAPKPGQEIEIMVEWDAPGS